MKFILTVCTLLILLTAPAPLLNNSWAGEPKDQQPIANSPNWDKLYIGMPDTEVESLLGSPIKKKQMRGYDQILFQWVYPNGGYVRFYMHKLRSIYKPEASS